MNIIAKSSMKKIIVLAWVIVDGYQDTGRTIMRDGCYRAVLEDAPKARAAVWSSDMARLADGRAHAEAEGYTVYVMDDTDDVLDLARARALKAYRVTATSPR